MWKATPLEEATLPCALPYLEGHAPEEVPPLEEATPRNTTWSWPESPRAGAQLGDCHAVLVDLERKRGDLARRGVKDTIPKNRKSCLAKQGGSLQSLCSSKNASPPEMDAAPFCMYEVTAKLVGTGSRTLVSRDVRTGDVPRKPHCLAHCTLHRA